jgi:hypothetical protein
MTRSIGSLCLRTIGKSAVRHKSYVQEDILVRIYSVYGLVEAFHGQVCQGGAFEDLVHEDRGAPEHFQWLGLEAMSARAFIGSPPR